MHFPPPSPLTTYNQVVETAGTPVVPRRVVNFTGAGVSVADSGGKTTVTIPGGGSGGGNLDDILALQALL